MASAEELQISIEAARRRVRELDEERAAIESRTSAAEERQRLRRVLDEIEAEIGHKEQINEIANDYLDDVNCDEDGPHLQPGGLPRFPIAKSCKEECYIQKEGDVANCRFNVFKTEHVWKIEGMSWLRTALKQTNCPNAKSVMLSVGPQDAKEQFQLRYCPDGTFGSLVIVYLGHHGAAFRYWFYIRRADGNFCQWGDRGDVCFPNTYDAFGPDRYHADRAHFGQKGVMGLSHDQLLDSEWLEDDTLTIKVEIEIRTNRPYASLEYKSHRVKVPPTDLISNLRDWLQDGKHKDITFIVEDEQIQAHSVFLSMRSDVFDRLLNGGMRESVEKVVVIEQCDPATFKALLEFLYTDDFDIMETRLRDPSDQWMASLQNLLAVSHRYQVKRLQLWCEQQLCDCLSVEDVCAVLCQAHLHDAGQLEQACLTFIRTHAASVFATRTFAHLGAEWPEVMVKINIAIAGIDDMAASAIKDACAFAQDKACQRWSTDCNDLGIASSFKVEDDRNDCGSVSGGVGDSDDADIGGRGVRPSPPHQEGGGGSVLSDPDTWVECCVVKDWSNASFGDEYLNLHENDVLLVRQGLEEGWAFGRSMSQGLSGWLPPAFVIQRN